MRKLVYWETAGENPSATDFELEFARIWQELPKIVVSRTVERVEGNATVVEKLQTALNEGRGDFAPSSNPVLAIDGIYGPETATAVKGAQESGGIEADGVVGLQTWALPMHAAGQVPTSAASPDPAADDALLLMRG
jgi:peptidoglycan hydrolase-like protein with peptidoglycan-binding domain